MLSYLVALALVASSVTNGQYDGNYRRTSGNGPPQGPVDRDSIDRSDEPVSDRRFQDYYYDSDVPEAGQSLQYIDSQPDDIAARPPPPPPLQPKVVQGSVRERPSVASKYNIRTSPDIPQLQQYEEYEYDRSCHYSQCKCRTKASKEFADVYIEERNCTSGYNQMLKACPNGLVYTGNGRSGLVSVCDYPHRAVWADNRVRYNPPVSTEHCDWLYGIFGHETSCTRYWTCWNGTATEQFCIGGLLYNEDTHACDWPQSVSGCQKHPLCKDDPNGRVPLGKSCDRYWSCQGGYPRLQRCPAMLVFDKARKRCVSPPTSDCDVPPTPPPSDDDQDGSGNGGNDFSNGGRQQRPRRPGNAENRRRFQQNGEGGGGPRSGGGGGNGRRQQSRPVQDGRGGEVGGGGGRPLPPDFQLPDGALPLNLN